MKHGDLMDAKDKADLRRAEQLVERGKALRARVMTRLRARAFRRKNP